MTISTVEISSRRKVSVDLASGDRLARGSAKTPGDAISVNAGEIGFVLQSALSDSIATMLVWPFVVGTWSSLSKSWSDLNGDRQFMVQPARARSWMSDLATSLCQPFHDACMAESTIGTALTRLPLGVALGVSADRSESLSQCLDAYAQAIQTERRTPMRALITNEADVFAEWQKAAKQSWRLGTLGTWQNDVLLKVWQDGPPPLPLELCSLMVHSIVRKKESPTGWNPIFDAVESKVRTLPPSLRTLQTRKKRSG